MNISVYPYTLPFFKWKPQVGGGVTIGLNQLPLEAKLQNNSFMQVRNLNNHRPAIKTEKKNCKHPLDLQEGYYKSVICLLLNQILSI